jgi:hypothetical protein
MSFPFGRDVHGLKQRLLFAIGGGGLIGLAAMGCSNSGGNDVPVAGTGASGSGGSAGAAGTKAGSGGTSGGSGAAGVVSMPIKCDSGASVMKMCWSRAEMESKAHFGCGQIQTMPEPTPAQIASAFLPSGCLPKDLACDGCCNPGETDGVPMADGSCCYQYCPGACCGRPFAVDGETRSAGVVARADWLGAFSPIGSVAPSAEASALPAWLARRIADEWLEDARMEHASIASFARFTLDLLSVGAPAALLARAQQAALDEVAHAEACFALAARYSGTACGPAALHTSDCRPAASLHDALLGAFTEGCVGETLAAAHAARALEQARDPHVRRALERIAEDEARHAELAWRFVAWGLPRCGGDTRKALRAALDRALATQPAPASERETPAARAVLHAAGRLTASERDVIARSTLREVIVPCAEAIEHAAPASSSAVCLSESSVQRSDPGVRSAGERQT